MANETLKAHEARPLFFIDVGARDGLPPEWQPFASQVKFVGIDPSCDAPPDAEGTVWLRKAAASQNGPVKLYLTRLPKYSSLRRPDVAVCRRIGKLGNIEPWSVETVDGETLDTILASAGVEHADFIKVDTQGTELDILRAADRTVERAVAIIAEISFLPWYEGQALFSDVELFLRERGFAFVAFKGNPMYWRTETARKRGFSPPKRIVCNDALFVREPRDPQEARRLALIYSAYGHFDLAAELLPEGERGPLLAKIKRSPMAEIMYFGRRALGRAQRMIG
ncbi:MAG: FkbM family methyltransferase [Pseudolabrys sp.]|nr:FkbM family methyltransferase [Pseudolabrys sp.]